MIFIAALVLMPAAWARAPHVTQVKSGAHRISTKAQYHREETSRLRRNSAEALRFDSQHAREPIYATQNPR
jgi:hypothetical protein